MNRRHHRPGISMHTFAVSDVKLLRKPMNPGSPKAAIAGAHNLTKLVACARGNPFVAAAHRAFSEHRPLTLSPDDVWLCIAQGFGAHVSLQAEALRSRFVRHQGQVALEVSRDQVTDPTAWVGIVAEFSDLLAEHLGKTRDLVVADFSTTGPVEKTASEVVLMSAVRHYFTYEVFTLCGIPEITLLGTPEDWESVRQRAAVLTEYGLEDWGCQLLPVLDEFVDASRGSVDREFWSSFYKFLDMSGGAIVTGWINVLFPYVQVSTAPSPGKPDARWNPAVDWDRGPRVFCGAGHDDFPVGVSSAPFRWHHGDQQIAMQFVGGFVGVGQDPDSLAVRPAIGWEVLRGG